MKLILASNSPRRREILKKINLDFKIISPDLDESIFTTKNINPLDYSIKLA